MQLRPPTGFSELRLKTTSIEDNDVDVVEGPWLEVPASASSCSIIRVPFRDSM